MAKARNTGKKAAVRAAKLIFADARAGIWAADESMPEKLEEVLDRLPFKRAIKKGDYVPIKMHFGSEGAFQTIRPRFVAAVVDRVRSVGGKPFVADTTRIHGLEYLELARRSGYDFSTLGCPVVMADGVFGLDHVVVENPDAQVMKKTNIASSIYYAPAMVVLSHAKGHVCAGLGGALKNLAMGCVSRTTCSGESSRGYMHSLENRPPDWHVEKCTFCRTCLATCPESAITIDPKKRLWHVDAKKCVRCFRCVHSCPTGALQDPMGAERFGTAMAESARAALSTFKPGRVIYISFVMDFTPDCDCMPMSDTPVVQDQGILAGTDPVAIDAATLDLVDKARPLPQSRAEDEGVTEPASGVLEKVTKHSAWIHVKAAERLGLGTTRYKLEVVKRRRKPKGRN